LDRERHLALLVAAFSFLAWPMAARTQTNRLTAKQIQAMRNLIKNTMTKHGVPGATFAIGLDGKLTWSEGFGYSDIENHVKALPETEYRPASIGKSMTATAAMELVEQGKLDLDKPIQTYCPRFPEKQWPITARDLISHSSGIRHYGGPNEQAELFNTRHYDHVSDALDLFKGDPLKQQPGTDMLYSTWGYVTLGCVIEGATHEEFREFMRKAIFEPAGMTKTRDDDPRAIIPNRARGYIMENGELTNSRWVDMSSKMAAGGWITTAPDLVRFMNAWMAGVLVSKQTMKMMTEPYRLPHDGTIDGFGLGWFFDDYRGMKAVHYGGGTPQVSGIIFFIPEKQVAIAAIFNLEDIPASERMVLAEAIADVILNETKPNVGETY
jgi:serine beta-lactamase-like protein LACTB, mitochondrial